MFGKGDNVSNINPRDMVGKSYGEIVEAATKDYWVTPISTDNKEFNRTYRVSDTAENGKVHYSRK